MYQKLIPRKGSRLYRISDRTTTILNPSKKEDKKPLGIGYQDTQFSVSLYQGTLEKLVYARLYFEK